MWNPNFSPQHGEKGRLAEFNGLLDGLPLASLNPWGKMPRGEVAHVLYRLLLRLEPGAWSLSLSPSGQVTISCTCGGRETLGR